VVEEVIERHEDLARGALTAGIVTGVAGILGLIWSGRRPATRLPLAPALLVLTVTAVLLGLTAHWGGRIHRPELAGGPGLEEAWLPDRTR
jgi:hypothetical protein